MANQSDLNEIDRLLNDQYGTSLIDVDEDSVALAIDEGEDPEAIVDWLAEKYKLIKLCSVDLKNKKIIVQEENPSLD